MLYLVDSDICIYAIKKSPAVVSHFRGRPAGEVAMSVITYMELVFGAWKSQRPDSNMKTIEDLASIISVLPLDSSVALYFAQIRRTLESAGTPIGPYDMLIAAHALSAEATLVTNNTREFSRVKGLRLENWSR